MYRSLIVLFWIKLSSLSWRARNLVKKFRQRAKAVFGTVSKNSGRARMTYLDRPSLISFSSERILKVSELQEDNDELWEENDELQEENDELREENDELREDLVDINHDFTLAMEESVATQEAAEHMSLQLNRVLIERNELVNSGNTYDEIGTRQKRSSLNSSRQLMLLFGLESPLVLYRHS